MSIVEAIDAEKAEIEKEIQQLEEQLTGRRSKLVGLDELRERAEALNGHGGGVAEAVTKPVPSAAAVRPARSIPRPKSPPGDGRTKAERAEQMLALLKKHPDGLGAGDIRRALGGVSANQFREARDLLGDKIARRGAARSTIYVIVGGSTRPSDAPASEGRETPVLPPRRTGARRESKAAADHNERRERLKAFVLELLTDNPLTKEEIRDAVLERYPDLAEREVGTILTHLANRVGNRRLEKRGDGRYYLTAAGGATGPRTVVERALVECLGDGATCKQIVERCKPLIRNGSVARAVAEGLVRREVIRRRPESDPIVFESLESSTARPVERRT